MTTIAVPARLDAAGSASLRAAGPIGRLGGFAADHARAVMAVWAIVARRARGVRSEGRDGAVGRRLAGRRLGVGAGAELIQRNFAGLVELGADGRRPLLGGDDPAPEFQRTMRRVERVLAGDKRVASVQRPRPGASVSRDGAHGRRDGRCRTATRRRWSPPPTTLKSKLKAAGTPSVAVSLTGSPGMWSDFNNANKAAMMKSELLSWPVTMAIIVLAFGSLVAAGLPLLLTILGLVASAGLLSLLTHGFDISIWAMNFALMFSLALGIDYALFIVHRFRGALFGSRVGVRDAVVVTMDTAGQGGPVLRADRAGLALGGAARAQPGVPVDGARDHHQRRLRARGHADPAARGAREARPEGRRAAAPLGALGRARSHALGALGRAALASRARVRSRRGARARRARPAGPRAARQACRRSRSSRRATARESATSRSSEPSAPARRERSRSPRRSVGLPPWQRPPGATPASPACSRRSPGPAALRSCRRSRTPTRRARPSARTIDRLRAALPPGALVGGIAAENHDLAQALRQKTPLLIGVVLTLGFLLLLVAIRAPVIAALAVVTNLLATARRLRDRAADLPGRPRRRPARLRVAGLHGRVGARVLLRDDLRDLDGLHRVPAGLGQGALGAHARPA